MPEAQQQGLAPPRGPIEPFRALMPSPIGLLGIEIRGIAITRLRIEPPEPHRSSYVPLQKIGGSDFFDEVFGRLSEYFAGARRKLEIDYDLSLCGVAGFARRVLKETAKIPYGRTRTYGALAEAAGRADAHRQVLSILLENPLPILIPCHRVVAGQGIGGYVGGFDRKRWLLDLEKAGFEL